jgi:hypothetical protein
MVTAAWAAGWIFKGGAPSYGAWEAGFGPLFPLISPFLMRDFVLQ